MSEPRKPAKRRLRRFSAALLAFVAAFGVGKAAVSNIALTPQFSPLDTSISQYDAPNIVTPGAFTTRPETARP